jgi:hypothetical protein
MGTADPDALANNPLSSLAANSSSAVASAAKNTSHLAAGEGVTVALVGVAKAVANAKAWIITDEQKGSIY